jgi:serine/threonine protein kinase
MSIENAMSEREVLMKSHHPFVVKLKYSFQDSSCIYFVMDYVAGGQLFDYLKKRGRFDVQTTRFYAAEVLLGL